MKNEKFYTIMKSNQKNILSPKEILYLICEKNFDKDWSFSEYGQLETGKWTHDYHRYLAKFIP